MPLIRRIPKRGFNNVRHGMFLLPVNLEALNRFEEGARVDEAALRSVGLANGKSCGIKILGTGELTRKLTVSAHAFSATAKSKIEARGGLCEVVAPKALPGQGFGNRQGQERQTGARAQGRSLLHAI